jgi:uncharacterized protein (DUF169 family)
MDNINLKFSDKFRSQWIKVKFYPEETALSNVETARGIRFCEAVKDAIFHPLILDRDSLDCPGARYAFGWSDRNELLANCHDKGQTKKELLEAMLPFIPHLKEPFKSIGLNTPGDPDLVISYILPESAMELIKLYHYHFGKNLDVSLSSMMPICSGIAVKVYQEEKMTFSFACEDSRKFAQIDRNRMVVGIPKKLFPVFVS